MRPFQLYNRTIGLGHPCFVIAEAGSNHNGDVEIAKQLIHAAADAKADAVKFQTFKASRLYPKSAGRSDYLGSKLSIYEIIKAMEMPESWLAELCTLTHSLGMAFISSPFHEEAVELLAPYVDAFKVASYELTHQPLLRAIAHHQKPIIMSTGASRLHEVRESVNLLRTLGCERLVVLQCTASYPAPPQSAQVGALVHLRESLGVLTGLSDHTEDPVIAPSTAAALGAVVIEKHYTLSKRLPGPDHPFAIEPSGLSALIQSVRDTERARGEGRKFLHPVEGELRDFARRSLFTIQAIKKGEVFTSDNLDILRQGKLGSGLAPGSLNSVLGEVAQHDLEADHPLQASDVHNMESLQLQRVGEVAPVHLRAAEVRDLGLVWVWANDPWTRSASLQSAPIPYDVHQRWFERRLNAQAHVGEAHNLTLNLPSFEEVEHMWIVEQEGTPVAFIRLDPIDKSLGAMELPQKTTTVSVHVAPSARGQGVGLLSLNALAQQLKALGQEAIMAIIDPLNHRSVHLFTRAGYRPLHNTTHQDTTHQDTTHTSLYYLKNL